MGSMGYHLLLLLSWMHLLGRCLTNREQWVGRPPCLESWVWDKKMDACFTAEFAGLTWYQAQEHCIRMKAKLVVIPDNRTNTFIKENIIVNGDEYWLGMTKKGNQDKTKKPKCLYMSADSGTWKTDSCHSGRRGYICMTKDLNDCLRNKCEQVCVIDGPRISHCECFPGYYPVGERGCEDIDECNSTNRCDQKCENKEGHYTCVCDDNYENKDDNDTCHDPRMGNKVNNSPGGGSDSQIKNFASAFFFSIPVICFIVFVVSIVRLKKMRQMAELGLMDQQQGWESPLDTDDRGSTPLIGNAMTEDKINRWMHETTL